MKSFHLIKSIESMYEKTLKIDHFDVNDFELYKTKTIIYKTQLTKYNIQHEIFKRFIIYIQIIIFITVAVFIQKMKIYSWNLLRVLKRRFVSFDEYRRLEIEVKYWNFCKGSNNQNIDKWLNSWQLIYFESKKFHVIEMQNNKSIKNFIFLLMKKNETWTNVHMQLINEEEKNSKLYKIIKKFRIYNRLKLNLKLQIHSHEVFSADFHQSKNSSFVDIKFDLKKNHSSYKKQKSSLSCVVAGPREQASKRTRPNPAGPDWLLPLLFLLIAWLADGPLLLADMGTWLIWASAVAIKATTFDKWASYVIYITEPTPFILKNQAFKHSSPFQFDRSFNALFFHLRSYFHLAWNSYVQQITVYVSRAFAQQIDVHLQHERMRMIFHQLSILRKSHAIYFAPL